MQKNLLRSLALLVGATSLTAAAETSYLQVSDVSQLVDGASYAIGYVSSNWSYERFFKFDAATNSMIAEQVTITDGQPSFSNLTDAHLWTLKIVNTHCQFGTHTNNPVFRLTNGSRAIQFHTRLNRTSIPTTEDESDNNTWTEMLPATTTNSAFTGQQLFKLVTTPLNNKFTKQRTVNGNTGEMGFGTDNNGNISSSDNAGAATSGQNAYGNVAKIYLKYDESDLEALAKIFWKAALKNQALAGGLELPYDFYDDYAQTMSETITLPEGQEWDIKTMHTQVSNLIAQKQEDISAYFTTNKVAKGTIAPYFASTIDSYAPISALWPSEAIAAAKNAFVNSEPQEVALNNANDTADFTSSLTAAVNGLIQSAGGKYIYIKSGAPADDQHGRRGNIMTVDGTTMKADSKSVTTIAQIWVTETAEENSGIALRNYLTGEYATHSAENPGINNPNHTSATAQYFAIEVFDNVIGIKNTTAAGNQYLHCANTGNVMSWGIPTTDPASGWQVEAVGELNDEHTLAVEGAAMNAANLSEDDDSHALTFSAEGGLSLHPAVNYGEEHVITISKKATEPGISEQAEGDVVLTTANLAAGENNTIVATLPEKLAAGSYTVSVPANMFRVGAGNISKAFTAEVTVANTTGISEVGAEAAGEEWFDLSGRRIARPSKGIYVSKSGKKMIVR